MKAITAERDRHASDKVELISKASAIAKECDSLREQMAAVTAERNRYAAEKAQAIAESERLKSQIAAAPSPDPVVVIVDFASDKTKALVAKARAAIPADSRALPWFDRTISALATVGRIAVTATRETARWLAPRLKQFYAVAAPRVRELYAKAKSQIENRLAKKQ